MGKRLKDVADVHYGKRQNEVLDAYGTYPIYGTGGVFGMARRPLFQGPGVVVGRKGTLDNPQFVASDFWVVDTAYAVMPKEDTHPKWLYYVLSGIDLASLNEATGVPSLNRDRLYNVAVGDFAFPEQSRIAYVLDTIDEAIQKTEAVIAKLKQIRAGMLHDLLTYGLDKDGKLRDPVAHPDQFKDSELGRIPKEWEVVSLDDLGRWTGGKTPSKADPAFWRAGTTPWVTPKDVKQRTITNTEDRLTALGASIMELFPVGALVVVGRSGILRHTLPVAVCSRPFTVNQDLKVLVPPSGDKTTASFLLLVLEQKDEEIRQRTVKTGTTVESIDWAAFKRVRVAWPEEDEREAILTTADGIDKNVMLYVAERAKLRQLKLGLMDDLLSGEVAVPDKIAENEEALND